MDINYCDTTCPIGIKTSTDFLNKSNSAFDAVIDFKIFTEECFKTCPYKENHTKEKK